jgi:hypothetical protein
VVGEEVSLAVGFVYFSGAHGQRTVALAELDRRD